MTKNIVSLLFFTSATFSAATSAAEWKGDTELGYILLEGNSESKTLNAKMDFNRESDPWRNNFHFEATNSSSQSQRSAEKYLASSQLDYKLNKLTYLFSIVSYEEDKFSGFEYEALIAGGYGRQFSSSETFKLFGEIGPGYRTYQINEKADENGGDREDDVVAYLKEKLEWDFSTTAALTQDMSVEAGEDNTISRFSVGVKSSLTTSLAMKVGYAIKYTDEVPTGIEHADRETTLTVVYSF